MKVYVWGLQITGKITRGRKRIKRIKKNKKRRGRNDGEEHDIVGMRGTRRGRRMEGRTVL